MSGTGGTGAGGATPSSGSSTSLSVRALVDDPALGVSLTLLAGAAGLERLVAHSRIQKSGLALAGHFHGIVPARVQILGQTELSYLERLDPMARTRALHGFFALGLSCVVITQGLHAFENDASGEGYLPGPELFACAEETGTPLLLSADKSSTTIAALHALLDDRLAPRVRLHGVLVDVWGVGLLLSGSSGIGKSECALDLVMRGHRLVADDVVDCDYRPPGMVFGSPADLLRHHLEVRGLGILNIKDLYGVTAIRERKRIDVVVKLVEWSKDTEYDRMGIDDRYHEILGVRIRELVIPVRPGRDMASILEVAARNELLRAAGHHAAREFFGQLEGKLLDRALPPPPSSAGDVRPMTRPPPSDDESAAPPPVTLAARQDQPAPRRPPLRAPESSASIPKPRRS